MNGLYLGSTAMMNYTQHISNHANNVSNSQTVGFKKQTLISKVLEEQEVYRSGSGRATGIGTVEYTVVPCEMHVNLTPGTMKITNSSTDFYLEDASPANTSFFVVEQGGQPYLTRNGQFTVNEDRYLKTTAGAFVLDENNNRIQLPENAKLSVDFQGRLYDDTTKRTIAALQTKSVDQETGTFLERYENGLYTVKERDIAALPAGTANVHNYMLENSNVDMAKEMADIMVNQRMVQASQRIVRTFDALYEKEATELAK